MLATSPAEGLEAKRPRECTPVARSRPGVTAYHPSLPSFTRVPRPGSRYRLALCWSHFGCLEDGRGRGAAEAASRVQRIHAEELVDEAAGDAEHGGAAVLALGVELEGLPMRVVIAHPRDARDVAGLAVGRVAH